MEAPLVETWLAGLDRQPTRDGASVSACRQRLRALALELQMPEARAEQLALSASELLNNQLAHARLGEWVVRRIEHGGVPGIEVVAADRGPGLSDVRRALYGGADASAGSLGVGFLGALRSADEVDVDVRIGEGTCVWARKFVEAVPPRPALGIYGRPHPGETRMGDAVSFARLPDATVVAVIDGLGHGPKAREPALMAAQVAAERAGDPPSAILDACHATLDGTRGAVMSVLRIGDGTLEHAGVGNVTVRLCRPRWSRALTGRGGVVGKAPWRTVSSERQPFESGDVLIAFSDGLKSTATVSDELALMREHPIAVAHHLVTEHFRGHDDAVAAVLRL